MTHDVILALVKLIIPVNHGEGMFDKTAMRRHKYSDRWKSNYYNYYIILNWDYVMDK